MTVETDCVFCEIHNEAKEIFTTRKPTIGHNFVQIRCQDVTSIGGAEENVNIRNRKVNTAFNQLHRV
jgi:hypothetical protein